MLQGLRGKMITSGWGFRCWVLKSRSDFRQVNIMKKDVLGKGLSMSKGSESHRVI